MACSTGGWSSKARVRLMSRSLSAIFRTSISTFFQVLLGLHGGVAGFLGVGDDVLDGGAGLVDLAFIVELVGIAKLMLRDPHAEFGAVFGARLLEACLKFVHGLVFGGSAQQTRARIMSKSSQIAMAAHGGQCLWDQCPFGSVLLRFNGDQAVGSLPLLIGILAVSNIQKMMIIDGGVFVVTQVVISGGPKKETDGRHLRIEQRRGH